jgi:hypothetical protein
MIRLTLDGSRRTIVVFSDHIESFSTSFIYGRQVTRIKMKTGQAHEVQEGTEEIFRMVNK